jgi:hypothetical protein
MPHYVSFNPMYFEVKHGLEIGLMGHHVDPENLGSFNNIAEKFTKATCESD